MGLSRVVSVIAAAAIGKATAVPKFARLTGGEEWIRNFSSAPDESWFEASVGMGSIDHRRGGIIQVVVGLGKPIELFRRPRSPVAAEKSSVIIAGPSIRPPAPSRARSSSAASLIRRMLSLIARFSSLLGAN